MPGSPGGECECPGDDAQEFLGRLNARILAPPAARKGIGGRCPRAATCCRRRPSGSTCGEGGHGDGVLVRGRSQGFEKSMWFTTTDQTRPVRSKPPNPWGFHDVHGNVWEWTEDWYHEELLGGIDPLQDEPSSFRVLRGGSWIYRNALNLRSANRQLRHPRLPGASTWGSVS